MKLTSDNIVVYNSVFASNIRNKYFHKQTKQLYTHENDNDI